MAYDHRIVDPYSILSLPHWKIDQWKAWYYLHNLIGDGGDPEFRADVRAAKGFQTLANHLRSKDPLEIRDLLVFPPPKPAQTPEQLQAALDARVALQQRVINRKTKTKDVIPDGDSKARSPDKDEPGHGGSQQGRIYSKKRPRRNK